MDGQPTFDNNLILSLPAEQVTNIQVFNTPEHLKPFGLLGKDGVIAFTTHSGSFDLQKLSGGTVKVKGTDVPLTFKQSPTMVPAGPAHPDLRPMLFWQGQLKTDGSGKVRLSFRNADDISRFRIVVEGITTTGIAGVGEAFYDVTGANSPP